MTYELIPHDVRKRHVRIKYKGVVIADGIDYGNGWYEVRPRRKHFMPLDRLVKMMTIEQIEELCERSYARHYGKKENFK